MKAIVNTTIDGIVKSARNALIVQYLGSSPPSFGISFLNLLGDASILRYSVCAISLPAKKNDPAMAPINGFFVKAYPIPCNARQIRMWKMLIKDFTLQLIRSFVDYRACLTIIKMSC